MRYTKPQVLTTFAAISAVQGGKDASLTPDSQGDPFLVTIPAYQADE